MNMSYCRFQNTLSDLIDCQSSLTDNDNESMVETYNNLSDDEKRAFLHLIETCKEIIEEVDNDDELTEAIYK